MVIRNECRRWDKWTKYIFWKKWNYLNGFRRWVLCLVEAHFNGYIILRLLYILMNTVSALGYCLSLKRSMPARLECLIIDGMNPSCYLFNTFVHIYLLSPFRFDNTIHHLKDKLPYPNAHILLYYIWLYYDSIPNYISDSLRTFNQCSNILRYYDVSKLNNQ